MPEPRRGREVPRRVGGAVSDTCRADRCDARTAAHTSTTGDVDTERWRTSGPDTVLPRSVAACPGHDRLKQPRTGGYATPSPTTSAIIGSSRGSVCTQQRGDHRRLATAATRRGSSRAVRRGRRPRTSAVGTAAMASALSTGEEQLLDLAAPRPRSPSGRTGRRGSSSSSRPCRRCRARVTGASGRRRPRRRRRR